MLRSSRVVLLAASLALCACDSDERAFAQFDGPTDVALLPPGMFEVPVAAVTSFRSGRVTKLDLKRTSVLVEDSVAPWMPGPDIAFGADRALSQVALVYGEDFVDVWVADDFRDELLRAPWIDGRDEEGKPAWVRPSLVGVTYHDVDGSVLEGDSVPELRNLRVRVDRAASDTWTMTWTGHHFAVEGLFAGPQELPAVPGTPYETDRGELAFSVAPKGRTLATGEQFRLEVESGIESADSGGLVTELVIDPTGTWVFASVIPDEGPGFVSVWDADALVELDRLTLPFGGAPERLDLGRTDGVVWVADSYEATDGSGRVFRLDFVPGDVDTLALTELHVPEPNIDVAQSRDPGSDLLFVAAAYTDAVWAVDPTTGVPIDTNPVTPEVEPTHISSIVSGLAASEAAVETAELDMDGTRMESYGVFATTFAGEMYWLDAATGCQVFGTAARAHLDPRVDCGSRFTDVGFESSPGLVFDGGARRCVITHACGGISRTETWSFIFSEELQSYEVEGTRSGVQVGRAFEGERYTTDGGELSVMILPGILPTTDGDRYTFPIRDGVTPVPMSELPGDPVIFSELFDDRTGEWFKVREREIAVVPHVGNDVILWVDLQGQGINNAGIRAFQ